MMTLGINVNEFLDNGLIISPNTLNSKYISFLQDQLSLIYMTNKKARPWHFWELHNPWGRSATVVDSWQFLDICQSTELLQQVTQVIGNDVILYDSQFTLASDNIHKTDDSWLTDASRCPVDPLAGLVVRIPFVDALLDKNSQFIFLAGSHKREASKVKEQSIVLKPGQIICHDIKLLYRITNASRPKTPVEYVIRFSPATSLYLRDAGLQIHRDLTEQYPLLNYARMPLWLVAGKDRSNNDFVTGFQSRAGRWINTAE